MSIKYILEYLTKLSFILIFFMNSILNFIYTTTLNNTSMIRFFYLMAFTIFTIYGLFTIFEDFNKKGDKDA